jgi:NAD(P)-dependent dehydrogenase (short-subunit alcohol dehydrogenase family)
VDLARHGARVLVVGRGESAAAVTREITAAGGDAVACVADARDGERIAGAALAAFGTIDALIVSAGVVRDRSFGKMSREEWSEVLSVHVDGAFSCAHAAWAPMTKQGGGAILFTTSGAGMHGNFGQANYAAAKGAILGLTRSLALEGAPRKIRVNAIAPMALTAMTERVFPEPLRAALRVEHVSPIALALVHPSSPETGAIVETGGGWASTMRWERSAGVRFAPLDLEHVLSRWPEVRSFASGSDHPQTTADSLRAAMGTLS